MDSTTVLEIGATCFGIVVGWITYRTLRRVQTTNISDLAAVLGVIGGAVVTGLFKPSGSPTSSDATFGLYCIGLFVGFFLYFFVALRNDAPDWLGVAPRLPGGSFVPPPAFPKPNPPPPPPR